MASKKKQALKNFIALENEFVKDLLITVNTPDSFDDNDDAGLIFKGKNINIKRTLKQPEKTIEEESFSKIKQKKTKNKTQKATLKKRSKLLKKLGRKKGKLPIPVEQIKKEMSAGMNCESKDDKNIVKKEQGTHEVALMFSKVAFKAPPGVKVKKAKREKTIKNPIESLKKVKEVKKKLSHLKETGDNKAQELKCNLLWKKALDKIEGKTVKDDSKLLYKAIKRRKDKHKNSKLKWIERKKNVEKSIKDRQKKRSENIESRIEKKKSKKLAKLCKKGHIIQ